MILFFLLYGCEVAASVRVVVLRVFRRLRGSEGTAASEHAVDGYAAVPTVSHLFQRLA